MTMKVRVWDSVRHAHAQGLAQRAAKLRPRHRAKIDILILEGPVP